MVEDRYWFPICGGGGWCTYPGDGCKPEPRQKLISRSQCRLRVGKHPRTGQKPSHLSPEDPLRKVGRLRR